MRANKKDFEAIVDEVSDGEGDEEAGMKARIDREMKEDFENTKRVVDMIANGTRNMKKYGKMVNKVNQYLPKEGFEDITGNEATEDFDLEEFLQKSIKERHAQGNNYGSDDEIDDDDPSEVEDENDDEAYRELMGNE